MLPAVKSKYGMAHILAICALTLTFEILIIFCQVNDTALILKGT